MPADGAALAEAFRSTAVVRRQDAAFARECACTRALHADYAQRTDRALILDGTGFRWEGLGNSGTRWMGLLRFGYATGRATYLRMSREDDEQARLDIGEYFVGWGDVDWAWRSQARPVRARMAARGVPRPVVLEYGCVRHAPPGCALARLRLRNGSQLLLSEPSGLLRWLSGPASPPWIRIKLAQQNSLEYSYSKPESLRTVLPLTRCPLRHAPDFRTRELALKCETFAFLQPRPRLMGALLPLLHKLGRYDRIIGVHLRTGYADWTFRNDDSYFGAAGARANASVAALSRGGDERGDERGGAPSAASWRAHWRTLDRYFHDCAGGQSGPCFNWVYPHKGQHPTREDAMRCGLRTPTRLPPPWTRADAPRGFYSSLLLCAARLGQTMAATAAAAVPADDAPPTAGAEAPTAAGGPGSAGPGSAGPGSAGPGSAAPRRLAWGLLVLSDAPAIPSLAAQLPALHGRVVGTEGAGQLGHSSFLRSCSAARGCARGRDPGGAWTRSLVDFYLAGVADGFVKGLFTSFLFSTMRRNLLCCASGAHFVQWMAWYNLSRSHRDLPMKDRVFMAALAMTHGEARSPARALT